MRAQLCVLLSLALLLAVAALAEPQLTVMEAGVVRYADVTSSANHLVLVIANNTVRNLVLQSYRVMVNLSGVLLVPAQAGGDGYFVVEGLDPSWQLLLVHMPRDFTTVQASYAFTVATRLPVLSGYIAESLEGGYYCYYSTTTSGGYTMYAAGQQAVTLWSSMHFYVHVAGAQLSNAYAWLGASSSQSSQAAGAQVYHNLYYIRVRDGSSSTQLTAGVSMTPPLLVRLSVTGGTSVSLYNSSQLLYTGTSSVSLASSGSYYPWLMLSTSTSPASAKLCIGSFAIAAQPVPLALVPTGTAQLSLRGYAGVESSVLVNFTHPVGARGWALYARASAADVDVTVELQAQEGATVELLDAAMSRVAALHVPAGGAQLRVLGATYLKVGSAALYLPGLAGTARVAPAPGAVQVAFTVQDFGAGYEVVEAYDLQGRLVGRAPVGATGQAAMNLTPGATYMIQLCKGAQLCKAVGLVSITSQSIVLTVMPSVPEVKPPSWVSAAYDHSLKALIVNVSCSAPPCTVRVAKNVLWYNYWMMRMPVQLQAGWNLVFLRKSSTVGASGIWAHVNASSWSEVRFGDESGLPERFLPHSVIWSNGTHAQVLVYAPSPGTYYLYWQPSVSVSDASQPHPFIACVGGVCGVHFDGVDDYAVVPNNNMDFTYGVMAEALVRLARVNTGYHQRLVQRTEPSANVGGFSLQELGGKWQFWVYVSGVGWSGAQAGGAQAGTWVHVTGYYDGSEVRLYVNGSLAASSSAPGEVNAAYTPTNLLMRSYDARYAQGYLSMLRLHRHTSPGGWVLALSLEAEPQYLYDVNWDGRVDWLDLSGNNNHAALYNFHATGSFLSGWRRQRQDVLLATLQCSAEKCGYVIYHDDPLFTVLVTDAEGRNSTAYTGMSVPLWQSPLGPVVERLGRAMNLDAWGVSVNDFVILLLGLAIVFAAFTYRSWEYAVIALGAWLSIGTLLLGGSGALAYPGFALLAFGAVLSLLLRKAREG